MRFDGLDFEEAMISTTWYWPSPGPALTSSSRVCIPVGQLIQKGADKDGVVFDTFIRLSLNSQNTFPLKKYVLPGVQRGIVIKL